MSRSSALRKVNYSNCMKCWIQLPGQPKTPGPVRPASPWWVRASPRLPAPFSLGRTLPGGSVQLALVGPGRQARHNVVLCISHFFQNGVTTVLSVGCHSMLYIFFDYNPQNQFCGYGSYWCGSVSGPGSSSWWTYCVSFIAPVKFSLVYTSLFLVLIKYYKSNKKV